MEENVKYAEEKAYIPQSRGQKCLHRRSVGGRTLIPKSNEKIGAEPDQFPTDVKKKKGVGYNQSEHSGGKEGKIGEI
jgi:hypothetical protein